LKEIQVGYFLISEIYHFARVENLDGLKWKCIP
jgi:hypothetical protein